MALSETQTRILNELENYLPALRKGQLSAADQIKMGDILADLDSRTSVLEGAPALAEIFSADAVLEANADADATYGTEEADLINSLKSNYNDMVALVNEIKASINNAQP